MWTYIWLGLLLAFILFLWRRGHLARLKKHVGETREQLKKCTWPTREELKQHTVVVLLSTLLLGLFIVVSDVVVQYIVWDVLPTLAETDTE
ncbi:MAG: preprotein translocase subunit SecE [Acidobacteria bacterium]|nr:preprotein translocase subunit SecE [Acidobacteriota bacterium]